MKALKIMLAAVAFAAIACLPAAAVADSGDLTVDMTLTAPNCPMADFIMEDVRMKLESIEGVKSNTVSAGSGSGICPAARGSRAAAGRSRRRAADSQGRIPSRRHTGLLV